MVEALWVVRKFSVVVLESPYTWLLSGPPDDPASKPQIQIEIQVGWKILLVSILQPVVIGLLEIKKWNNQIQENNNLRKKWLKTNTTKCWARLLTNCCTLFWRSSLHKCIFTKNSIRLGSHLRVVACKIKILLGKNIYK
jgi:hypothetical protein